MKTYFKGITTIAIILLAFTSCRADLIVKELDVSQYDENKTVKAVIANVGNRDASNFLVYFNGDENPMSQNHRPQVSHNVPGLGSGDTILLTADFSGLSHVDNNYLGNIFQITVLVDPKNMVKECNEDNNSGSEEVEASSGTACVDFEPPPAVGTKFGNSAGNTPGDIVMTVPNGIEISVHNFEWVNGGGTFNFGQIETSPGPLGSGLTLHSNNINFEFDFTNVGFAVSKVTFEYLDLGGFENLSINGQPAPIFTGELDSAPASIGGVNVVVITTSAPGGKRGTVTLTGSIDRIRIGGQEFWIDNLCAEH